MSPLYDGADIPRRTFNNWKEAIQQAFDINIECRRVGGYHYYIENPEDLENSTTCSWLLNTFTVKNIISESKGIRDRILLENVPSGQKHLTPIIDAMQSNKWLEIVHGSYWYDRPDTYTVQPWCLKLFTRDGTSAATAVRGTPCAHLPWTASEPERDSHRSRRRMCCLRIPAPAHLGLLQHHSLPHGPDRSHLPRLTPGGDPQHRAENRLPLSGESRPLNFNHQPELQAGRLHRQYRMVEEMSEAVLAVDRESAHA